MNYNFTTDLYKPQYYKDIHGFFDFEEIYQYAVHNAPEKATFIEIGVMQGKSACYLAECIKQSGKDITVYIIDVWDHVQNLDEFDYYIRDNKDFPMYKVETKNSIDLAVNNLRDAGLLDYFKFIQFNSAIAYKLFKERSVDFIFIDGDHSFEAVRKDFKFYYPLLKKNGIFAGHDYVEGVYDGLITAVNNFCKKHHFKIKVFDDKMFKPFIFYR